VRDPMVREILLAYEDSQETYGNDSALPGFITGDSH